MHIKQALKYAKCIFCILICLYLNISKSNAQAHSPYSVSAKEYGNFKLIEADTTYINSQLVRAGLLLRNSIDSGRAVYEQALKASLRSGYKYGIAHALIGISIFYIENGEHEKANTALNQALPFCKNAEIKRNYILGVWNDTKGTNAKNLAQSDSAVYFYEKALEFARKLDDKTLLATVHINLGSLYIEDHNVLHEYSIKHLENALLISQDKIRAKLPIIYSNFTSIYQKLKNDSLFWLYANKAIEVSKELNDKRGLRLVYNILGDYYLNRAQYDSAIEVFNLGLKLNDTLSPFSSFSFYYGLSACYYELNNISKALHYGKNALAILKESERNSQNSNNLYKFLAKLHAESREYEKAYELSLLYEKLNDTLNNVERKKAMDHFNIKYETSLKDAALERQKMQIIQKDNWIISIALLSTLSLTILTLLYLISKHKQKLKSVALKELEQKHKIDYLLAQRQGEKKERQRISRELHDGIASTLAAAKMKLTNINELELKEFEKTQVFNIGLKLVQEAYNEVRQTAHNLSNENILSKDLVQNLQTLCNKINTPEKLSVNFLHFGTLTPMEGAFIVDIFRVVQELLHNIIKYAQATEVNVSTIGDEQNFAITIEDNGNGMFINQETVNGLGWGNLKTRIYAWGGEIEVDSRERVGTTIYINFKLPILKTPNEYDA